MRDALLDRYASVSEDGQTLTVRGYVEALRHIPEILGIRNELKRQLLAEPPSVFVGVDAPDFNFGLEHALRDAGIPTIHFVCPSIWAWRGGRIKKIQNPASSTNGIAFTSSETQFPPLSFSTLKDTCLSRSSVVKSL